MACLRWLGYLTALSTIANGVLIQAQRSSVFIEYDLDPTALPDDFDDNILSMSDNMLMPYSTVEHLPPRRTTSRNSMTQQPSPTPTPILPVEETSGSGDVDDLELVDTTTTTVPPSLTPTATQSPVADVTIRLRLSFDVELSESMVEQFRENLSNVVREILELNLAPEVIQETDDTFSVLIVTFSSQNEEVASGDLPAIAAKLSSEATSRLYGVANVQIISIVSTRTPPPMTVDHFAFPLWQWFIYALCAVIVTTAILLLILLCCHRCFWKRSHQNRPRHRYQNYKHLLLQKHPPEEMVDFIQQPSDHLEHDPAVSRKISRISFRPRGPMQLLSHPLTPEELQDFAMNPLAVHMEYSSIPSNMVTMAEVPPGAEEKNRFKDVLPNPHTRVALFLKFAVPNSDYINANYIRGYRDAPKAYIATQGPLYWTVSDFWRMIWEQKCSTIVMMTGLEERGITKCARYWPNERVQHMTSYEDLELILKRKLSSKDYTTTTFHLRHKQKLVTREVTHFWFTAWPDHGVPSSARTMVEFLLKARHHLRDIPGPTVVHCSAGIGRTGVFIGAEVGMQQMEEKGEVDILKIVSTLRQDRGGMVQTKDQYLFLYQVLVEYSKYLERVRSPYKSAAAATAVREVARPPLITRLETPREEDEESTSTI